MDVALRGLGPSWVRVQNEPLLDPRRILSPVSGARTLLGVPDPCVVWDSQDQLWRVYWSFVDPEAEERGLLDSGIASASSSDGVDYSVSSQLALEPIGTFDATTVETCEVVEVEAESGRRFFMYYSGSVSSDEDDPEADSIYILGLATSDDGVRFTPVAPSRSPRGELGALFGISEAFGGMEEFGNFITDPTVVIVDGLFYMWTLCVQQVPEPNGGICHHRSRDGVEWEHLGLVSGLERGFPIQPTVYYNEGSEQFEMYVVMDTSEEEGPIHDFETNLELRVTGFYRATSQDGMSWTEIDVSSPQFGEDLSRAYEDRGLATGADVVAKDNAVYLFYPSFTTQGGSILGDLLNWPLNLAVRQKP
ncbi:MAG: hypothetical protein AAFP04_11160 [Myxococcota bacterium]